MAKANKKAQLLAAKKTHSPALKRIACWKDKDELVNLVKQFVTEDPAKSRKKWNHIHAEDVVMANAELLGAIARRRARVSVKALADAFKEQFTTPPDICKEWAKVIEGASSWARVKAKSFRNGDKTDQGLWQVMKHWSCKGSNTDSEDDDDDKQGLDVLSDSDAPEVVETDLNAEALAIQNKMHMLMQGK